MEAELQRTGAAKLPPRSEAADTVAAAVSLLSVAKATPWLLRAAKLSWSEVGT